MSSQTSGNQTKGEYYDNEVAAAKQGYGFFNSNGNPIKFENLNESSSPNSSTFKNRISSSNGNPIKFENLNKSSSANSSTFKNISSRLIQLSRNAKNHFKKAVTKTAAGIRNLGSATVNAYSDWSKRRQREAEERMQDRADEYAERVAELNESAHYEGYLPDSSANYGKLTRVYPEKSRKYRGGRRRSRSRNTRKTKKTKKHTVNTRRQRRTSRKRNYLNRNCCK
jgi:hypothetical protein